MWKDSNRRDDDLALEQHSVPTYNERAFRHFLDIERRRAERSGRSVLLMLVSLRAAPGTSGRMEVSLAGRVFSGLSLCVREVDFIGWFRTQRVAAAVLTLGSQPVGADALVTIAARGRHILLARLPASAGARLKVRVVRVPSHSMN